MRKFITTTALALSSCFAIAQTTATDFTANDCNSTSHTLFNELNSGQVVVMVWVMPCGACVNSSKAAYNAVQSFATTNPGKVKLYIMDDYGDASCSTLTNWITSNNIGNLSDITVFDNSGNTINMSNYGSSGMPKVIVVGGSSHQVFYNRSNSASNDQTGITGAIQSALSTTGINDVQNQVSFSLSPNPVKDQVAIIYEKPIQKVAIITINGQVVRETTFSNLVLNPVVSLDDVANGIYLIKIIDADSRTGIQKMIKQ